MHPFQEEILKTTKSEEIIRIETIQELWSGYGKIQRIYLKGNPKISAVVAKHIHLPKEPQHPRGWNSNTSHQRKIKSYEIEQNWYKNQNQKDKKKKENSFLAEQMVEATRTPELIFSQTELLLLEDLNQAGYSSRKRHVTLEELKIVLKWLANFHGLYLGDPTTGLWEIGTYWHLSTRTDEFQVMAPGSLKQNAHKIDDELNQAKFQTLVHGDAKLANFCFSEDGKKVAAVDFQYIGGGCGMKDIAYFLGSCLDENGLFRWTESLLDFYFKELKNSLSEKLSSESIHELEKEWRYLFDFAWADFDRFLLGWMPAHSKINQFSQERVAAALLKLAK